MMLVHEPPAAVLVPSSPIEANPDGVWPKLAERGGLVVVLALGIVALWRWASNLVERLMSEQSAALTRLQDGQAQSIAKLTEGVHQVELAVTRSDERNVAALAAIRETVTATVSRLDKHDGRLDRVDEVLADHGARLRVVEASSAGAREKISVLPAQGD